MKKYALLSLKIILWILGTIIFLVLLVFFLIRVPAVQNYAKSKAISYLEGKIKTKVEINRISLDLPKLIVLEDIYFEDQKRDTLLAGDTLKVDISLLKLLDNEVEINEIDLRGITANIQRTLPDSAFNFDYIINAFVSQQKKEPKPEDTTSTMKFSIDKINLDRIKTTFKDAVTANDVSFYLRHFDTRIKDFDLDKMKFNIPKATLSGVNARVIQSKPAAVAEPAAADTAASQPINMDLAFGTLDLSKINIYYQNDVSAMKADVKFDKLQVESDKLDLKNQTIRLKNINLNNSNILFALGKTQQAKVVEKEAGKEIKQQAKSWRLAIDNIDLSDNNIRFDNFNQPVLKKGLDYGHMDIKGLNVDLENLLYATDTISGDIKQVAFKDKSGFDLQKLQTNFFYGKTQAYLNNLDLQTSATRIRDRIRLNYPSIESLTKNPGELRLDANLTNSRLGFKDVLTLMPALAATDPFKKYPNAYLNINTKISGQLKDLSIPNLKISGFRNTRIDASAKIKGLPDMNKAYFDLKINDFSTQSSDILAFLPPNTLPANIRLPQVFKVRGTFKGGITNFATNLDLNSSYGSAKAIASYNAKIKGRETYKANLRVFNFNVGRLIKQDTTIGRVTLAADVSGTSIDPKTMSLRFSGKVIKAEYNKYAYRNLNVKGTATNGLFSAKADMSDENLDFDLDATANMKNKYPAVKLALNLDSVNLQKLNFVKDDIRFRGKLLADLKTADPDYLNGTINLTNALMSRAGDTFTLDTVSIVSTATEESNTLDLKSEIVSASLAGKYKLTEVGTALQDVINKYYALSAPPKVPVKYSPQQFKFNARIVKAPILNKFAPDLKEMAIVTMDGNFNSQTGELRINANAPKILYGENNLNNLKFTINTDSSALNYSLVLGQLSSTQFQLQNTSISGKAQNNVLTTDIQIRDKDKKDHYRIAGSLKALQDNFIFSLNPNGLLLNYQPWTVSADNAIQFGSGGVMATNFSLSNTNQSLTINTNPPGLNNPIEVNFKDFRIETLTQIAKKDSLLVGGTINGSAVVRDFQTSPVFTSDLTVGNFNFRGDTVGTIALKVNNERADTFAANVKITGNGNEVNLNGLYYTNTSSFDMKLNIANLNLKSIEGFTFGNLKDASGSIKGDLDITGTTTDPKVRGDIGFNKAAFNIAMLNSYYRIDDDKITFNDDGIRFNDFTIIDSASNTASIDGTIFTKTFTDYRFALDLNADNFMALNSSAKDNELYYGKVLIDSRLHIKGDMNAPVIDGDLKINEDTKLTVVLPQEDPAIEEREGIVEFIDMDNIQLLSALTSNPDSAKTSSFTGIDATVNLTIDKNAEFNVVVDQGNGDFLKVRGQAQLSAGIDPGGKISLTGVYELEEGAYELSFNFIQRRFEIKKGSTITWTGEPLTADVNLTATYIANTAPLDLVDNQLGDVSQSVRNTYKQKLPFEVDLNMKGELMKPEISFGITLPEKNYNVSSDLVSTVNTRLDQLKAEPSELNKQVFALLLLNRFVGENPFQNNASGGGGVESLARQSVSKLLSEQLNNLAGNLIAGVELNFDLQSTEDYTTGQMKNRTDLNVGVSKRLLNDRLKVSVGSNFELEGPKQSNQKTSNIAGDVSVEYQLSKDGRYLLRAYQQNQYQEVVQGQVIETGVGFIITMDYNKFKELFEKTPKEQKERKRAERAEKKQARKND